MANGLLDMLMPSSDDALKRAIMAAGFGLLGTRKGQEAPALGRAGLLGMGVYDNSMEDQLKGNITKLSLAQHIAKMQAEQQAAQQQQEAMGALAGMPGPSDVASGPPASFQQPGGASALMSGAMGGPTPPAAQLATQMAAPTDDPSAQKMAQANYLEEMFRKSGGKNPTMFMMAQKLREEAMKMRDENQGFETVMGPNGPQIVQRRKFGAPQTMPFQPKPEMTMQDLGGSVQAIDKLRTPAGTIFNKTLSPDTQFTGGITMRGQNMTDARARDFNAIQQMNAPIKQTVGQNAADQAFAKDYIEFKAAGGIADTKKQLAQLRTASKDVVAKELSGPVIGSLPDFMLAATNPDVMNTRDAVLEVAQRNLRLVLGAQFTQKEGEMLLGRVYNPRLPPEENQRRIDRLAKQIETAAQAKQDASNYFEKNGTLTGWQGKLYTLSDFNPDKTDKQVVRRGTGPGGKRVVQYSDGTIAEE